MTRNIWFVPVLLCTLAGAVACGKEAQNIAAPTGTDVSNTNAGIDGSTLKATSPTPQSPVGGAKVTTPNLVLTIGNSSMSHSEGVPLTYRFQIFNPAGNRVYDVGNVPAGGGGQTSHTVSAFLEGEVAHTWQARAEYQGAVGPWSARANFIAPVTTGYINGNELYDPLINGKSVGTVHGDAEFIPNLGIRLNSQLAYVSYELPDTLMEGEFSILVTNLRTNTEGGKTKLMAMSEGYADIVTNDRRMTIEKRGDPAGVIAWRLITHGDQVDTEGPIEREFREFDPGETYLWEATWRNNFFNVLVRRGGANGPVHYEKGKHFTGRAYDPDPHVIYIGAPVGRSGPEGASVDGVIIRQVWVSSRPRPAFANR
jgi:hypothetical protein